MVEGECLRRGTLEGNATFKGELCSLLILRKSIICFALSIKLYWLSFYAYSLACLSSPKRGNLLGYWSQHTDPSCFGNDKHNCIWQVLVFLWVTVKIIKARNNKAVMVSIDQKMNRNIVARRNSHEECRAKKLARRMSREETRTKNVARRNCLAQVKEQSPWRELSPGLARAIEEQESCNQA